MHLAPGFDKENVMKRKVTQGVGGSDIAPTTKFKFHPVISITLEEAYGQSGDVMYSFLREAQINERVRGGSIEDRIYWSYRIEKSGWFANLIF